MLQVRRFGDLNRISHQELERFRYWRLFTHNKVLRRAWEKDSALAYKPPGQQESMVWPSKKILQPKLSRQVLQLSANHADFTSLTSSFEYGWMRKGIIANIKDLLKRKKETMHRPGFEPGWSAPFAEEPQKTLPIWKADILTTILPVHFKDYLTTIYKNFLFIGNF